MPSIKILPSTYTLSNSSYLTIADANNMYTDTDSTTYAIVTNTRSSTTSYYIYIQGFDFSQVPSGAVVTDWAIRVKARESGVSTSTSYVPALCNGTSTYSSAGSTTTTVGTTAAVITFTNGGTDWETLSNVSNFGIRLNCRRASRNTTSYMYIYGAEIEVDYYMPVSATVTSTLNGEGIIDPSGATSLYEGEEYTLMIIPTNSDDPVTATKNGVDITSSLITHSGSTITCLASSVTTTDIQSGGSYAEYAVGHSAEDPSTSGTSSNMYSAREAKGYAEYSFDFSAIPSTATITGISVRAYGHRESSTIDETHMSRIALYNGTTAISNEVEFQNTSNEIITVTPTTTPIRAELDNITMRHFVDYYGGLVLGISFDVTYASDTYYTYTYTVDGDATIAVVIGMPTTVYLKINGTWTACSKVYLKVNGAWVEQDDPTTVFNTTANYVKAT